MFSSYPTSRLKIAIFKKNTDDYEACVMLLYSEPVHCAAINSKTSQEQLEFELLCPWIYFSLFLLTEFHCNFLHAFLKIHFIRFFLYFHHDRPMLRLST